MTIGYYFLLGKHFCCVTVVGGRSRVGLHTIYKILDPRKSECRATLAKRISGPGLETLKSRKTGGASYFLLISFFTTAYVVQNSRKTGGSFSSFSLFFFSASPRYGYAMVGLRKETINQSTPFARLIIINIINIKIKKWPFPRSNFKVLPAILDNEYRLRSSSQLPIL